VTAGRRLVAHATPGARYWVLSIGTSVGFMAGSAALQAVLPSVAGEIVAPILGLVGFGVLVVVIMRAGTGRKVILDVGRDRVVVDEGRGGTFSLAGASLGPWRMPGLGVVSGTILQLAGGSRHLRILGMSHQPRPGTHIELPADEGYDVRVSAEELQALLDVVPVAAEGARPPEHLRCDLLPHPASPGFAFAAMAPWMGTLGAVFVLQGILGATGLFETRWGQYVSVAITLPLIIGGIVWTFRRFSHKRPSLQIDLGPHELEVRNPTSGRVVSSVPLAAIGGTRAMCRIVMKGATVEHAVLQIRMPGHADLTVGVYDPRYGWKDTTPWVSRPSYIVSAPDWEALVGRLGLRAPMRGP
jgi:hypothetical protein